MTWILVKSLTRLKLVTISGVPGFESIVPKSPDLQNCQTPQKKKTFPMTVSLPIQGHRIPDRNAQDCAVSDGYLPAGPRVMLPSV